MKRRDFLKYTAPMMAAPLILHGQPVFAFGEKLLIDALEGTNKQRKLILIQLNGGNDGLNTLIPLDRYANLFKARNNVLIKENKILPLEGQLGLHPSLSKIKRLYEEEKVLFVQNVGYPEPNFSHFRSKDIVTSGSGSGEEISSGWMGRVLDDWHPAYPENYPNDDNPHPVAISIGSSSSPTCQGSTNNLSMVLRNLNVNYSSTGGEFDYGDGFYGDEMRFITKTMEQTEVYLSVVKDAADKGENRSLAYPEAGENSLADQLKIVANLISGGLETQIYVVNLGGFDTHSAQVAGSDDTNIGKHSELLKFLSDSIYAFLDDLKLMEKEDDVIGFTFSEFGRRIKSNNSLGTDHGAAWPAILFGSQINPTVLGNNPVIADVVGKKDNLPMQFDFRSLYASVFKDWFGVDEVSIKNVLLGEFEFLPILKSTTNSATQPFESKQFGIRSIYPNPAGDVASIDLMTVTGRVSLHLYSTSGAFLMSCFDKHLDKGKHTFKLNTESLNSGTYVLILRNRMEQSTRNMIVL